jgi:tetratricopeptide (TPR) repeat protein
MVEDLRQQLERLTSGQLGTNHLRPVVTVCSQPIEEVVGGQVVETGHGPCVVVDRVYPGGFEHGRVDISAALAYAPKTIAAIGRDPGLEALDILTSAFLDVETTGLAGGAGTYAFLVGIGWFEEQNFHLRQVFMRHYGEESALVSVLEETLAPLSGIVSFNGKAFDVPLLESRFILSRRRFPLSSAPHLDLLHTARRLWRLRLESCRLSNLETEILGLEREGDVPSDLVPQIYFDYLRYGQVDPLKGVFYHNAQDILSLAALTALSCTVFDDPLCHGVDCGEDLYSLGRLYVQVGLRHRAEETLRAALEAPVAEDVRRQAVYHLSFFLKRQGNWSEAIDLWNLAIEKQHGRLYPFVELAKYYEHRARDFAKAEELVLRAIDWVESSSLYRDAWWRDQRLAELEHRLRRVQLKKARHEETLR